MNIKTILILVGITVGVLVGMTALLWNFSNQGEQVIAEVAGEMRHVLGEGKIVVTEFSDLQCPACAGVQAPLEEILAKYEGKVKLVFRHLPLTSIHKNAMVAAIFLEAASEQGKFWEMHDLLYARQEEWSEREDLTEKLGEYGSELGLDTEKLMIDMEREDLKQVVLKDNTEAIKYKIQGTPTFFVNGERVEFPGLDAKIQGKLVE